MDTFSTLLRHSLTGCKKCVGNTLSLGNPTKSEFSRVTRYLATVY